MSILEKEILANIKQVVQELEPLAEIVLYGSRARGDVHEESDWDLLILVPKNVDFKEEQRFRHKLFDLELEYGQAISTIVKSKKDWDGDFRFTSLFHNINQEGVRL